MSLVYVNGRLLAREAAAVSVFDRSFLYGDGLFETVRAYGGAPFMLTEHLGRMACSARELGFPMPDLSEVAAAAARLVELNNLTDAYIRITLSRGLHAGALAPEKPPEPTLVIEARELRPYSPALYERGAVVTASSFIHDSSSPLRRHKTTSYMTNILAKREAKERGADEALLLDHNGSVAEAATSNVFCVRDGVIFTPPLSINILPGITRAAVLGLAGEVGLEVRESPFGLPDLKAADEMFLTNSLMEVLPVRSIDGTELRSAPGPVTGGLASAYGRLASGGRT